MRLDEIRICYWLSCFAVLMVILSPTLAIVVKLPVRERFSELWIVGAGQEAKDYPFKVTVNETYNFYLGVGNYMGYLELYRVDIKFGNQSDPFPDIASGNPSGLNTSYEYHVALRNGEHWNDSLEFSISKASLEQNVLLVNELEINGYTFDVEKTAIWSSQDEGYIYRIFVELWIYDDSLNAFAFHNRFVDVALNVTVPF